MDDIYGLIVNAVRRMYEQLPSGQLPFHNWHHIQFVVAKSMEFGKLVQADRELLRVSALLHDLNYIVKPDSTPSAGKALRFEVLRKQIDDNRLIELIENTISSADISMRHENMSAEAMALSDADTLFKVMPITPILFSRYMLDESHISIFELAQRILRVQLPLVEQERIFCIDAVRVRYQRWAEVNVELWKIVSESENDQDVLRLLSTVSDRTNI